MGQENSIVKYFLIQIILFLLQEFKSRARLYYYVFCINMRSLACGKPVTRFLHSRSLLEFSTTWGGKLHYLDSGPWTRVKGRRGSHSVFIGERGHHVASCTLLDLFWYWDADVAGDDLAAGQMREAEP